MKNIKIKSAINEVWDIDLEIFPHIGEVNIFQTGELILINNKEQAIALANALLEAFGDKND